MIRPSLFGCLIVLALSSAAGPVYADEDFALLRLRYDLAAQPRLRVDFGLVSRLAGEGQTPQRGWMMPLYDTLRDGPGPGFRHSEDSQPFCERTLVGCLAIGAAMAAGILVFVNEFANQSRNDSEKLTVTVNTGSPASP